MTGKRGWTIPLAVCLGGLIPGILPATEPITGYGPWQFGMTPEEVRGVAEHGPYAEVSATGGLETQNGVFEGERTHVSFVFGPQGLRHIQIWAYTGESFAQAARAWGRVHRHLGDRFGDLAAEDGPWPRAIAAEDLADRLAAYFGTGGAGKFPSEDELRQKGTIEAQIAKLHLRPVAAVPGAEVFASFMKSPQLGLHWVLLYYRPAPAPPPPRAPGPGGR